LKNSELFAEWFIQDFRNCGHFNYFSYGRSNKRIENLRWILGYGICRNMSASNNIEYQFADGISDDAIEASGYTVGAWYRRKLNPFLSP
jgi:hypothetical protein